MSERTRYSSDEVCRQEVGMHERIRSVLSEGPRSVPQLATALERPAAEVMVWIMAMRRYGQIVESAEPDDDDFYEYALATPHQEEPS